MKQWERQRDDEGKLEPNLWFDRFTHFRLMGPGRSLLGCVNQERVRKGQKESNYTPGSWRAACEKWQWRKRAEAWDAHCRQEDEEKWKQRREEIREREWETASKLLEKAERMLTFPVSRATVEGKDTVIEPADWKFRDIPKLSETASKLARLAAQMETASLDVTSKGEKIGGEYTDEQRRALVLDILTAFGIEIDPGSGDEPDLAALAGATGEGLPV